MTDDNRTPEAAKALREAYGNTPSGEETVILKCAADIEPENPDWIWKYFLARGKIHLLAGPMQSGKSNIAFSLAAILSKGGEWPDKTKADAANTIIWSGEDDDGDTIVPRLIAAGADLSRIFIISEVSADGTKRLFDPSTDLAKVAQVIDRLDGGAALVIIDPFVSALEHKKNSHNNAEARQGLQHVKNFVEKTNCAVLGIHHFSKGTQGQDALERVTGSIAFSALARMVFVTAIKMDEEEEGPPRSFVRAKSSIGQTGDGFGYNLLPTILQESNVETVYVEWQGAIKGDAQTLIDKAERKPESKKRDAPERKKATSFLMSVLKGGAMKSEDLKAKAEAANFSWETMKDAIGELKSAGAVNSKKEPGVKHGKWWYALGDDFPTTWKWSAEEDEAEKA
ncbi:MAG: AAA family ATPase [Pseudomonadota bacterium]